MSALHVSRPQGGVVLIEIDNPPANAIDRDLQRRLADILETIERDLAVRVAVLTGRGKGFCAGDDLRQAGGRSPEAAREMAERGFAMLERFETLRVPVIAAVNGHAVGGGFELALACDIRIASDDAFFVAAAVNIGLIAPVERLIRLIGAGPAKAMLLTGNRVSAAAALGHGLVSEIHPPDQLAQAALAIAGRIASRAPLAVEASKRMIRQLLSGGGGIDFLTQFEALRATDDHRAALDAFREGKTPHFTRS